MEMVPSELPVLRHIPGRNPVIRLGKITDVERSSMWVPWSHIYSRPVEIHHTRQTTEYYGDGQHRDTRKEEWVERRTESLLVPSTKRVEASKATIFLEDGSSVLFEVPYVSLAHGDLVFHVQHRTRFGIRADLYRIKARYWANVSASPPERSDMPVALAALGSASVNYYFKADFFEALSEAVTTGLAMFFFQHVIRVGYSTALNWRRWRTRLRIQRWMKREGKAVLEEAAQRGESALRRAR